MWVRKVIRQISNPRRFEFRVIRMELLALFPLLAVGVASIWDRTIAEATGIVLPIILALDVLLSTRARLARRKEINRPMDPVTGLPMRIALDDAIIRANDEAPGLTTACYYVRIDGQELLAERWGAEGRDEILRRTAERLRVSLRTEDTVARVEDGTFGIVLRPVVLDRLDDVLRLAERLSAALADPIYIGGGAAQVTASIGVATPGPLEISDLLSGAEAAVAEARRLGPGSVHHYSRDLKERLSRSTSLTRSVDSAFAAGELRAWFQPQINTDTGEISGFEALARWHHPTMGVIAPGDFLDAIRHAGRMTRLGETMLTQALTGLVGWDRKGLRVPSVSVNFSPEELRDPALADRVKWEVDRFDLKPSRLTVEILESVAALGHDDIILRNIDQLGSHGFNLDLDDFGTGQASIANIRRFGVQRIKIDRSFVTGLNEDPEQQSMVAAILSLAHHLGVETIAEGVETTGEHSVLAQLGCGHVQGYGVSRPIPYDQTFAWMASHREMLKDTPEIGRKTG